MYTYMAVLQWCEAAYVLHFPLTASHIAVHKKVFMNENSLVGVKTMYIG